MWPCNGCKEVVRLVASGEELSLIKRAELQIHYLVCKGCSRYAAHLQIMRNGFRNLFSSLTQVDKAEFKKLEEEIIYNLSGTAQRK